MKSVLFVDDDVILQKIVSAWFQNLDINFSTASDAETAKQMMLQNRFDVVIVDFKLPGESGLELTKFLAKDTPVIFVTAFANLDLLSAAWHAGAFDFLEKPLNSEKVLETTRLAFEFGPTFLREPNFKLESGRRILESNSEHIRNFEGEIDFEFLKAQVNELGSQLYLDIFEDFKNQIFKDLSQFKKVAPDGNPTKLEALSHKIASTLTSFGCLGAYHNAKKLEHIYDQSMVPTKQDVENFKISVLECIVDIEEFNKDFTTPSNSRVS